MLRQRVELLELAVLRLGRLEFGDVEGHDFHGNQWTGGGGGSPADGTKEHPYPCDSAIQAAKLISEGKFVKMDPGSVSILLDKLAYYAKDAQVRGERPKVYDLCKITVPDSNLFCAESKNIPRVNMPQLSGTPLAGSKADGLPVNKYGETDITDQFRSYLTEQGHSFKDENVQADVLKATQNELNGAKVAGIMETLEAGKLPPGRIFVSSDNYIVDGHHRWAANVGVDYNDGSVGNQSMPVTKVDMPISVLLPYAQAFATSMGIPQQSSSQGVIEMVK